MSELFIMAGCNGAGKTTAAYNLLPEVFDTVEFLNADEIARSINPQNVSNAAFLRRQNNACQNNFFYKFTNKFCF